MYNLKWEPVSDCSNALKNCDEMSNIPFLHADKRNVKFCLKDGGFFLNYILDLNV